MERPKLGSPLARVELIVPSQGAIDVVAERVRQIEAEGWSDEHDDGWTGGQLAIAASCYALNAIGIGVSELRPLGWPWEAQWWKPRTARDDLVRAAALLIAEIDRRDRAAAFGCESCGRRIGESEQRYVCHDGSPEFCRECAPTWGEDLADALREGAAGNEIEAARAKRLQARLASGEIKAEDKAVW